MCMCAVYRCCCRAARKREEERIRVEKEIAKKGKKKGLNVLSGRALFDYDATLFK